VFRVKWVERFEEMSPIETEDSIFCDLDEIVEKCRERLEGMGFKNGPRPPDGFVVCDEDDKDLRRWYGSYPMHRPGFPRGL
jgi:hypothetical protein